MKTFISSLILAGVCLLSITGCEKDEDKTILRIGESSTLYASTHTVVMQESIANDNAIAFTWTSADFGYSASTNYTVELSLTEDGFAAPVVDDAGTSVFRREYTVIEFNKLVMQLGLQSGVAQDVLVRVKATVANTDKVSYSEAVTVNATAYVAESPYATLYLVGDAAEFGWDAAKATPMFRDEDNSFVYTYTGYLNAGDLKILGYLNSWAPQWGSGGAGKLAISETNTDTDPPSLSVAAAGYYTFRVDLQFNTYTLDAYDASGAATYAVVGIAGSFDSWANNTPMTNTTGNPHIWSVTYTLGADSEVKFTTPSWSPQWGISGNWDRLYGKAALGGSGNMWIYAGSYRFLFNDLDGRYVLVKQ